MRNDHITEIKSIIEEKLKKIADVWNYFILEYQFCSSKIKFTDEVKTNYLGEIFGYFNDTLDVVFTVSKHSDFNQNFSFTISFLQAIYIQQDFIQEMLEIFETHISKKNLLSDEKYSINRNLRNELVGHPIRKYKGKLISSTLISYRPKPDEIEYARYHRDNQFIFESKSYKISEIHDRHFQFLNKYLDIIILKLESILGSFSTALDKLQKVIEHSDLETILNQVDIYFESFYQTDFVYDKASILKIYERKDVHPRYKTFIQCFTEDLRNRIIDKNELIKEILEGKVSGSCFNEHAEIQKVKIEFINPESIIFEKESEKFIKESYRYEIGKLYSKRNIDDFDFFSTLLRNKFKNNQTLLDELNHMQKNISNEIEYYTSLKLISMILKDTQS